MTVSVAQFRQDLPAFSDAAKYPDTLIQYNINMAVNFLNAAAWGPSAANPWPALPIVPPDVAPVLTTYDYGVEWYAAHNIILDAKSQKDGLKGFAGAAPSLINNKSVDKVSVGFDTITGTIEGAGEYNLTIYGIRFWRQMRMIGAGAIQVNVGPTNGGQSAWAGPGAFPYIV